MPFQEKQKHIIITGASKGLGFAMACRFAEQGYNLCICSRNEVDLYHAAESLLTRYPQCRVHAKPADLAIKEEAINFAKWCLQYGTPDILINNAGLFFPGSVYNEPDENLEGMIAVNLYSAYHVTRVVLPAMIAAKRGHIFNICSTASIQAYNNGGSYSISKYALLGFSKNLREEMKAFNIKVTAVIPGAVYTDSWSGSGINPARIMEANDISAMVYAASQLSPQACVEDIVLRPLKGDL